MRVISFWLLSSCLLLTSFAQTSPKRAGYTATLVATFQPAAAVEPKTIYEEKRWVSGSGTWKSSQKFSDGKQAEKVTLPDRGTFRIDFDHKRLLRLTTDNPADFVMSVHPETRTVVRTEVLLGMHVDVYEIETPDGKATLYRAAELNGDVVKVTRIGKYGKFELRMTDIQLSEPSQQDLVVPDYPVLESK